MKEPIGTGQILCVCPYVTSLVVETSVGGGRGVGQREAGRRVEWMQSSRVGRCSCGGGGRWLCYCSVQVFAVTELYTEHMVRTVSAVQYILPQEIQSLSPLHSLSRCLSPKLTPLPRVSQGVGSSAPGTVALGCQSPQEKTGTRASHGAWL